MLKAHCLIIPATLVALSVSGCGKSGDLYPVDGKVLYHGEPAVGATVSFIRKGVTDRLSEQVPQGTVQEDGSFELSSPLGQGAAAGDYIVLVEWKQGAGKTKGRSPALNAPDRLKKRYLDPSHPVLTAVIESKSNVLPPFELK
jgi:hypothetical protein